MASTTRRLAAILAADIAGYSRLMEADEVGTVQACGRQPRTLFRRRQAHRDRLSGIWQTRMTDGQKNSIAGPAYRSGSDRNIALVTLSVAGGLGISLGYTPISLSSTPCDLC